MTETTMLIRLIDGTDLISNVSFSTNSSTYELIQPMEYMFDGDGSDAALIMHHYLPLKMVKKNAVSIQAANVLFAEVPDDNLTEFYVNMSGKLKELFTLRESISSTEDRLKQAVIDSFTDLDVTGLTMQ